MAPTLRRLFLRYDPWRWVLVSAVASSITWSLWMAGLRPGHGYLFLLGVVFMSAGYVTIGLAAATWWHRRARRPDTT